MSKTSISVLYILNHAPDYRDVFLSELGKHVSLTVVAFDAAKLRLREPYVRENYRFIKLKEIRLFNISLNLREFLCANGGYDVIILGYNLRNPFRLLNVFRSQSVLFAGHIYGASDSPIVSALRKFFLSKSDGILVYSTSTQERLRKELNSTPITVFNNTSFFKSDLDPLPLSIVDTKLNVLWVGRFQKRKKVNLLLDLAKRNNRVHVRLIGPGILENINEQVPENFEVLEGVYGKDLRVHFQWAHVVFNPGAAGLIVMNAARFSRAIVIGHDRSNGPEIQLALESGQIFADFEDADEVDNIVANFISNPQELEQLGRNIGKRMENYTVENMVQQYLKAMGGALI